MVIRYTDGRFLQIEDASIYTREQWIAYFANGHEHDIIQVNQKIGQKIGQKIDQKLDHNQDNVCNIYHLTYRSVVLRLPQKDLRVIAGEHTFYEAALLSQEYGVVPVVDRNGNVVEIVGTTSTYYDHAYQYTGKLDLSFLNRYQCIILCNANEYSVELYRKALPSWTGKKLLLLGDNWTIYQPFMPSLQGVEVELLADFTDQQYMELQKKYTLLMVQEFLPKNEDTTRYKNGIMSYDEIMILTFMFSYQIRGGEKNPDKQFFLINGYFKIEGLFAIWDKVMAVARYAKSKGYIPAFEIVSSDDNMYSDYPGDDIWNKFYLQPEGYTLEEIHQSSHITISPNANVLSILHSILDEDGLQQEIQWPAGCFNEQVEAYINERRERMHLEPSHTLGVLIRGTDYTNTNLPGHSKHANLSMIMEKIEQVCEKYPEYQYIYLATEDTTICEQMKQKYGDILKYTDQKRFQIQPGQLLYQLHTEKEEGKGFRLGVEYLCSIRLLSECDSLIASGQCCGVTESIRENAGKYREIDIFDLGINARN